MEIEELLYHALDILHLDLHRSREEFNMRNLGP